MVKSDAEIQLARHAVAIAMMHGGREAIAEGVPEYEVGMAHHDGGKQKGGNAAGDALRASDELSQSHRGHGRRLTPPAEVWPLTGAACTIALKFGHFEPR